MTASITLDPVALLGDLLQAPSVTGATDAAAVHLVELAGAAGFESRIDPSGNVVMPGAAGRPPAMSFCSGHLDTVPGDIAVRLEGGLAAWARRRRRQGPAGRALAAAASLPRTARRSRWLPSVTKRVPRGAREICAVAPRRARCSWSSPVGGTRSPPAIADACACRRPSSARARTTRRRRQPGRRPGDQAGGAAATPAQSRWRRVIGGAARGRHRAGALQRAAHGRAVGNGAG